MMPCKAQLALIALVVVLGSMQMLASCGQKGDLYLPEDARRAFCTRSVLR
ncbi:MAG: lipoprotein [Thioalkalivibrio sp.]|nr:lipoprotein [Thioalkalivibrio sp.]